jgi:hypothetical protein
MATTFRVFPNENQQEFDDLVADYHRTFVPTTTHEQFLVEEMAQSRWRLARLRCLESAVIEQMIDAAGSGDAYQILAAALIDNTAGPVKTLQRYAAATERSYYRALKQLQTGRQAELQNEPKLEPAKPVTRSKPIDSGTPEAARKAGEPAPSNPSTPFTAFPLTAPIVYNG